MDVMRKREIGLYAVVWVLVFALVPACLLFSGRDFSLSWREMLDIWAQILPFFLLFLIHDTLAAPFLLRKKWKSYLIMVLPLLVLFGAYCFLSPQRPPQMMEAPPLPPPGGDFRPAPPDGFRPLQPEVMKVVIGLLVIWVNLGVKAVFRNIRGERQLRELEAQRLLLEQTIQHAEKQPALPEILLFKMDHKTVTVPLGSIRYIESMSEYVKIWLDTQDAPLVVLYSLKRLMDELPEGRFMRIHRSYIVALSRIREASAATVTLEGGITLPVSESARPAFRAWLNTRNK